MKKLNQTFAAFAVTAMLAGGSSAWAQDPVPVPEPAPAPQESYQAQSATGELVKVDPDAMTLTIKGADGAEWAFRYNDRTEVAGAQEGVAGLATKAGSVVTVHFEGDGESRTATKIEFAE